MTRMPRSAAYSMMSLIWAWVKYIPSEPNWWSFGKTFDSTRNPWSSVRWRWRTFILTAAMPSRFLLMTSTGWKCRPTSMRSPRQVNRGWSEIETQGK